MAVAEAQWLGAGRAGQSAGATSAADETSLPDVAAHRRSRSAMRRRPARSHEGGPGV